MSLIFLNSHPYIHELQIMDTESVDNWAHLYFLASCQFPIIVLGRGFLFLHTLEREWDYKFHEISPLNLLLVILLITKELIGTAILIQCWDRNAVFSMLCRCITVGMGPANGKQNRMLLGKTRFKCTHISCRPKLFDNCFYSFHYFSSHNCFFWTRGHKFVKVPYFFMEPTGKKKRGELCNVENAIPKEQLAYR